MKNVLFAVCTMALLSACGPKTGAPASDVPDTLSAAADSADADAERAAVDFDKAAASAAVATAKRIAGYKTNMLALLAGTYGGDCKDKSGAATKEAISVSSTGLVSAKGVQHDIMAPDGGLVLGRVLESNQPVSAYASALGTDPAWSLVLTSGAEESLVLTDMAGGHRCDQVALAARLRAKPLYPAVAPFFIDAAATLSCMTSNAAAKELPAKAGPAGLTLGERIFSFTAHMKAEVVSVDPGTRKLTYNLDYHDGGKLVMVIDDSGKIADVLATDKDGTFLKCEALAR